MHGRSSRWPTNHKHAVRPVRCTELFRRLARRPLLPRGPRVTHLLPEESASSRPDKTAIMPRTGQAARLDPLERTPAVVTVSVLMVDGRAAALVWSP